MKKTTNTYYGDFILATAGAALRCGRYLYTLKRRKKKDLFDIGYHMGKLYGYHWVCCCFRLGAFIYTNDPKYDDFLKDHRGWWALFPTLNKHWLMVMPYDFFNEVLKFELKSRTELESAKIAQRIIKKIRSKCLRLK